MIFKDGFVVKPCHTKNLSNYSDTMDLDNLRPFDLWFILLRLHLPFVSRILMPIYTFISLRTLKERTNFRERDLKFLNEVARRFLTKMSDPYPSLSCLTKLCFFCLTTHILTRHSRSLRYSLTGGISVCEVSLDCFRYFMQKYNVFHLLCFI